jgi:TRAP-type C4-dicarboxylate transport system permease large subunit
VIPRAKFGLIGAVTLSVLVVLVGVVTLETADKIDASLVKLGGSMWSDYALELRRDPNSPLCDLQKIRARREGCTEAGAAPAAKPTGDDDPFGAPSDPFGEPGPKKSVDDDPFGAPAKKPAISCARADAAITQCHGAHSTYRAQVERITPVVQVFRTVELAFAKLATFAYRKHLLSLILLLAGVQVTFMRSHIALRMPRSRGEHRTSQVAQLVAHGLLAASAFANWRVQQGLTVDTEGAGLPVIWLVGFVALVFVNLFHLIRPPSGLAEEGSTLRAVLSIPLYAFMVIGSGLYFLLVEGHPSGQAIYLHKFVQIPTIYLAVALYVWGGMLLERSALPKLAFGVLRPWGLPPLIMGWIVVVLAAVPTAYSGASGIFVIAAGAVIFTELRRAGASAQDSVMFTAMSGSLGVVLRPCLVVVLIAALNNEVTTDQLFESGLMVFGLTAGIFLVAVLMLNKDKLSPEPCDDARSMTLDALRSLVPYIAISAVVLLFYKMVLDTGLNERTASQILPVMLLALLVYEHRWGKSRHTGATLRMSTVHATEESTKHIGALLFLMAASVCLGGVIERMEVMELVPDSFGSPAVTMGVLVVIMVIVGMTMDAMGAVILVSVTMADVAYRNGIDPVHFWMMVLVAFELGYLTPPVSLNHLLARQVIGPEAEIETQVQGSLYARYRHVVIPMAVMGISLLLVAFVPLFW